MVRDIVRSLIAIALYSLLVGIIPSNLPEPLLILVGGIILLIAYYKDNIKYTIKRIYYHIFDVKGQINIMRISKYTLPEDQNEYELSHSIIRRITDELDNLVITDQNSTSNFFRFKDPDIPEVIEVRLEPEPNFDDLGPDLTGYKLVIETYSDMIFGYKRLKSVDKFEDHANNIERIIQRELFPGEAPSNRFIIATIKGETPFKPQQWEDKEFGLTVSVSEDQNMELRMDETERFSKAIRKYFQPVKSFQV